MRQQETPRQKVFCRLLFFLIFFFLSKVVSEMTQFLFKIAQHFINPLQIFCRNQRSLNSRRKSATSKISIQWTFYFCSAIKESHNLTYFRNQNHS
jgi:hypothetical protein